MMPRRERLLKKQAKEKALKELLDQLKGKPNVTKDGRNVMVYWQYRLSGRY